MHQDKFAKLEEELQGLLDRRFGGNLLALLENITR